MESWWVATGSHGRKLLYDRKQDALRKDPFTSFEVVRKDDVVGQEQTLKKDNEK